jgi:5-methylcytosine-specific restriction endonuclease McrA
MKPIPQNEVTLIAHLYSQKLSLAEIARKTGRSRTTITRYLFPEEASRHKAYCKNKAKEKSAYDQMYYEQNREKRRAQKQEWREKNKAYAQQRCAKWLAKKNKCPLPYSEIEELMCINKYQEAIDMTTATSIPHEVDHIAPMSKQGPHLPWNLRVLTATANKKKYNLLP